MKPDKIKPRDVPADYPEAEHPFGWEDYWGKADEVVAKRDHREAIAFSSIAFGVGIFVGSVIGYVVF